MSLDWGGFQLRRKTFDEAITDAHIDFLYDYGKEAPGSPRGEFFPLETPNRNPAQVPNGIWTKLIYKHLNKHFYN